MRASLSAKCTLDCVRLCSRPLRWPHLLEPIFVGHLVEMGDAKMWARLDISGDGDLRDASRGKRRDEDVDASSKRVGDVPVQFEKMAVA